MRARVLRVLPLLIASVALASASGNAAPMAVGAWALVTLVTTRRLPIDRATQRLALLVVVALVVIGVRASGMPARGPGLGAFGFGFALAPLALVALRLVIASAEGGARVDHVLTLVSLLAAGAARPGPTYLAFVIAHLASVVAQRRSEDAARPRLAEVSARGRLIAALVVATAALSAGLGAGLVHVTYSAIQRRFQHAFETRLATESGLSDSVRLGDMAGLLESPVVVLRVLGPSPDRLRAVVLDEYAGGRWTQARALPHEPVEVPRARPKGASVVEVRHVSPDRDHVYLPLDARGVATARGALLRDELGAAYTAPGDASPVVWFSTGPRDALPVAEPRREDLLVPHSLRAPLRALATEWTRGATTQEEAVRALEQRLLTDFSYSLEHRRRTPEDPILEFLTVSRAGHCEYFATALALLARSLGVPARVVLGYRVAEHNPYSSHFVVRKKNAHAWVEAQVRAHEWSTFDATPPAELPQNRRHEEAGAAAVFEAAALAWDHAEAWLAERSVFELGAAAVLGVVVFALQRWLRERRGRAPSRDDGLAFSRPPLAYERLEAALERRGLGRGKSEPIERWAARVGVAEVERALLDYARARYRSAEGNDLEGALERASSALSRADGRARHGS